VCRWPGSRKVTPRVYLIGLSNHKQRNLQLLRKRAWFDIAVAYANNGRAILSMDKGTSGEHAFDDAFKAWNQYAQDNADCRKSGAKPGPAHLRAWQSIDAPFCSLPSARIS
jgi:hypothetical protein